MCNKRQRENLLENSFRSKNKHKTLSYRKRKDSVLVLKGQLFQGKLSVPELEACCFGSPLTASHSPFQMGPKEEQGRNTKICCLPCSYFFFNALLPVPKVVLLVFKWNQSILQRTYVITHSFTHTAHTIEVQSMIWWPCQDIMYYNVSWSTVSSSCFPS